MADPRDWQQRISYTMADGTQGEVILGEKFFVPGQDVCTTCGAETFTEARILAGSNCKCGNNSWRNTGSGLAIGWSEPARPARSLLSRFIGKMLGFAT